MNKYISTNTPTGGQEDQMLSSATTSSSVQPTYATPNDTDNTSVGVTSNFALPELEINIGPVSVLIDPSNSYHQWIGLGTASSLIIARLLRDNKIIANYDLNTKAEKVATQTFLKKIDSLPVDTTISPPSQRPNYFFQFLGRDREIIQLEKTLKNIQNDLKSFLHQFRGNISHPIEDAALNLLEVTSRTELSTAEVIAAYERFLTIIIREKPQLDYNTIHYIRALVTLIKRVFQQQAS